MPLPAIPQISYTLDGHQVIKSKGPTEDLTASLEICDVLKSKYIVVALVISNTSPSSLGLSYNALQLLTADSTADPVHALNPDALLDKLTHERASRKSHRTSGTIFVTPPSAHTGSEPHAGSGTAPVRTPVRRTQAEEDLEIIQAIDQTLLRTCEVAPARQTAGMVFFPFTRQSSYTVRVQVHDQSTDFVFRLRSL